MTADAIVTKSHNNVAPSRPACGPDLCRLISFQPWRFPNEHLIGHADIDFDDWQINHIPVVHRKDGSLSVGVPSSPEVGSDGAQLRDDVGERKYVPLISFSGNGKEGWERAVLGALSDTGIDL